jgi:phosphoribosylformylglycinamidine cyclo-ligase
MGNPDANWPEAKPPLRDAYARAGVDIAAGNLAVARYRELAAAWRHPSQLDAIGGFGGLFALPGDLSRSLVASADGVGTKTLIAAALRRYESVGADLVNHCVNDILVMNATPLFFLDYLAMGRLDPEVAGAIVSGVHLACRAHEMALLGGETAEMPGMYETDHFDLAGTIVGVVETARIPDPTRVRAGDAIVGLPAAGLHTNGYTLARALIARDEWAAHGDALLAEHPSYYRVVRAIEDVADVKVMAHITGGGLLENVPRTLPEDVKAIFEQSRWSVPPLLAELVRRGELAHEERYRTFNMGIGFTLVMTTADAAKALGAVPQAKVVGWLETRAPGEPAVVVHPSRTA